VRVVKTKNTKLPCGAPYWRGCGKNKSKSVSRNTWGSVRRSGPLKKKELVQMYKKKKRIIGPEWRTELVLIYTALVY
jgi:hypothetical protein